MEALVGLIVLFIIGVIALAVTFLPAIVAFKRKHNQALAIFMVVLFLGWTFIGWAVAMIWACTSDVKKEEK